MAAKPPIIRTGCCGFAIAQAAYFQKFSSVEIDSTFYQLPRLKTAASWRAAAPKDFQFALTAWQVITHRATSPTYKRTRLAEDDRQHCGHFGFNATIRWAWDETFAVAQELRAVLVLFQCQASFTPTADHITGLKKFFERAKRGKLLFGWEPRGAWEPDQIAKLCRELDLIHVVDPLKTSPTTGKFQYFRLHGLTGASHRYSDEELAKLRKSCQQAPTSYCFFNNTNMVRDVARFAALTK